MGDERLVWTQGSGWQLLLLDELGDVLGLEVQVLVGSRSLRGLGPPVLWWGGA